MNRSVAGRQRRQRAMDLTCGPTGRAGGDMQLQKQQPLSGTGAQIRAADRGGRTARCVRTVDAGCEGVLDTLREKKEALFKTYNLQLPSDAMQAARFSTWPPSGRSAPAGASSTDKASMKNSTLWLREGGRFKPEPTISCSDVRVVQREATLPGSCISWRICRFPSRPDWC